MGAGARFVRFVVMAANYIINVPKLRGRENYDEWVFAAENFLILEGMMKCIKTERDESGTEVVVSAADDAKTKAKLVLTIDSSLYVHIKTVKTTKELWEKLKSLFDDSGFTRKISLLRNLISIRLENCSSMTSYVTQIIETGQKLCGTGFAINDEWIGSLLLAGLPEKFSPMIMAIEHSGIQVTTDAIKSKLLDMETGSIDNVDGALAVSRKCQPNKWKSSASMSGNTGKDGVKYQNENVNSKTVSVRCYRCKQTGHYRSQCPNNPKFNKNADRKQSNAFSAVFLSGSFNKTDWYIDSGASVHLTANVDWITSRYRKVQQEIMVANQETVSVTCAGDVKIVTSVKGSEFEINIEDVYCVPNLTTNLISVSRLIQNGNKVHFTDDSCHIYNKKRELVATASLINGVYKLNLKECLVAAVTTSDLTWHRRLGHLNSDSLRKTKNAVEGMSYDENSIISKSTCKTCCEGKQCRLPFTSSDTRSTELLNVVHSDLCGPMEATSLGGASYFLLFVDDFSRMTFIYFLKHKNEVLKYFKEFKALAENQTNRKVKTFRTDNGKEFCNTAFDDYLKKFGIVHQKSNPYTPQQNGLCERMNRTVIEKAKCMLYDTDLAKKFWAEACNTAVYLHNRIVSSVLDGKTPYELWTGVKPDLSNIRIFGSPVMVHVNKEKRSKWDRKSIECILLGYPDNIKGYRLYDPKQKRIFTSRDVIIMEKQSVMMDNTSEKNKNESEMDKTSGDTQILQDSVGDSDCTLTEEAKEDTSTEFSDYVPSDYEDCFETVSSSYKPDRPVRERRAPDRFGFGGLCYTEMDSGTGLTLKQALKGPERDQWLQAVQEELECFEQSGAWEVVNVPDNSTIVQCKWVLKKKVESSGKVRYRARLVAKGFTQQPGVDYAETFSPVVRYSSLRLLFAISVKLELDITHLDVCTAFLNGDLNENIYMQMPEGFKCPDSDKVLKLKKAIYGLKQSSRMWYNKVDMCLTKNGYSKSKYEPCLYTKKDGRSMTIIALYVDDFFVFSNNSDETNNLKCILESQFKIKDLGQIRQCLGMSVHYDKCNKILTLDQCDYIQQLLQKFNMVDCKAIDTPMECGLKLTKDLNCDKNLPYQQLIGCLIYLAILTRPDITFPVVYLSQFNNCYNKEHWAHAKRILRYLKGTKDYCIKYSGTDDNKILGYVDADWGSDITDRRSYTGYCFTLSSGLISWGSKKQKNVTLSSTEAEYVGISECCKEAIYLRNLQSEIIGLMQCIVIFNDNQSAHKLLYNPVFHNRTKHIDIRFHFGRECIKNNVIKIEYLQTDLMPADILTKSLNSVKHYKFLELLGVQQK